MGRAREGDMGGQGPRGVAAAVITCCHAAPLNAYWTQAMRMIPAGFKLCTFVASGSIKRAEDWALWIEDPKSALPEEQGTLGRLDVGEKEGVLSFLKDR